MEAEIKTSELRLGNYFQETTSKEIIQVENISKDKIGFSGYFTTGWQAEPIELTEEWLLKLGFDKDSEYIVGAGICWHFKHPKHKYKLSETFRLMLLGIDLKYLHQLQNLYFALCGEELTINEGK